MSTETVVKTTIGTAAHQRWYQIVDAYLPVLFIGAYVLGMGALITVLMVTGRLHG